jgi:O-antigen/teichoic acid export membrane protein
MKKQGIAGTVILYLGVLWGFVNSTLLFPKILGAGVFGFIQTFSFTNNLIITFVLLGLPGAVIRFYPYFKDDKKTRDSFFTFVLSVGVIAIILGGILLYLFKWDIILNIQDHESRELARQFFYLLFFNLLSYTLLSILDAFNTARQRPLFPIFLTQIFSRALTTVLLICYYLEYIDLKLFLDLYGIKGLLSILLLIFHIEWRGFLGYAGFKPILESPYIKPIFTYSLFIMFTGLSNNLIAYIDTMMISAMIDFTKAGIYAVFYFISTTIIMPVNAFGAVISPRIAEHWKKGEIHEIHLLNQRTTKLVLVLGVLVFAGILGNLHNVVKVLGEPYRTGIPIGLYLGFGQVFAMSTGFSSLILIHSSKYKMDLFAKTGMAVMTIGTNYFFIKSFGATGAAMATALTMVITSSLYLIHNYVHWKFHPFTNAYYIIFLAGFICWLSVRFIPIYPKAYLDLAFRAPLMTLVYFFIIYVGKVLPDVNDWIYDKYKFIFLK